MGNISFDTYLVEEFLQDSEQAEAYLKEAIVEGDLELLKMSIENLLKAGYGSFKTEPIELIENISFKLQRQKPAAEIEIIGGQKPAL